MEGEMLFDAEDMMLPSGSNSWISSGHYQTMVDRLSRPTPDPEMITVGGVLGKDDEVTANSWYTVWTDKVTPISRTGSHVITFRDQEGAPLLEHHFNPIFEMSARLTEEGAHSRQSTHVPFFYTLP